MKSRNLINLLQYLSKKGFIELLVDSKVLEKEVEKILRGVEG